MRKARSTMATRWLMVAAGQLAFLAGLESHIVQQCRFGECIFGDRVGVVNALPPAEKVQQLVRIASQGGVRQAAEASRNRGY